MAACPNCGQENPEGFVLCGMCGTPLAQGPRTTAVERKVVTVLFGLADAAAVLHDARELLTGLAATPAIEELDSLLQRARTLDS